jgi:hypothetical protein
MQGYNKDVNVTFQNLVKTMLPYNIVVSDGLKTETRNDKWHYLFKQMNHHSAICVCNISTMFHFFSTFSLNPSREYNKLLCFCLSEAGHSNYVDAENKYSRAMRGAPSDSLFGQFCLHALWFGNCNIRGVYFVLNFLLTF